MSRFLICFAIVCPITLVAGCGGDAAVGKKAAIVPLTGKLLVDGQPRGGASLQFMPLSADGGATTAYAVTEADGSFSATTYVTGDGIAPGKYKISLGSEEDNSSTDPMKMMAAAAGSAIKTSEIEIPAAGLTDVEIKLTSESGGKKKGGPGMLGL